MMNRRSGTLVLLFCALLIAGCAAPPAPQPSATPAPVVTVENTPAPIATEMPQPLEITTPTLDVSTICPVETEGTTLYVSTENGLCFLYPSGLTLGDDLFRPEEVVHVVGSLADPNAMETVAVNLAVAYNGPADGLVSAGYANKWVDLNMPGIDVPKETATIGGQPAVVLDNLPGMFAQRGAFVVANGIKYQLALQPRPQDVPKLADEGALAWDTVTQSIVFFPPQNTRPVVRAEDVCPTETAGTKLVVDQVGGYCLLYPAEFAPDPAFPAAIVGGPELGSVEGFDSVRTSLAVGSYDLGDQPPEQSLHPISEQIDSASLMTTTIAGYPAVVYDFTGGPWRQHNAQIVVGDIVYTFVGQPWDAEKFPQALPDVERLWETVSESIAFFDKWR